MKNKPTKAMAVQLSGLAMTERHAQRMARGVLESKPSDFRLNTCAEDVRARDARSRLEDMRLARELGVDLGEVA